MSAALRGSGNGTTNGTGKSAVQGSGDLEPEAIDVKSDADWFVEMAHEVHPDKPGTNLHLNTGVNERLCQKYAARNNPVRPSSSFLRALLRTEHGWAYLQCLMRGSDAPWWVELQACLATLSQFVK